MARVTILLPARTCQPRPLNAPGPPELPPAVVPGSRNVLRARQLIIFGNGPGLFIYNGQPGRGTLILAAVGQNGTDPTGQNTVPAVFNIGVWDATTGTLKQHFGVDSSGRVYIAGPDGVNRIIINNGTGGVGPDIRFFNDFGAVILVVDPSRGGTFQYQDNNSATQGTLIGAQVGKNTTDPINGTAVNAGITIIDPVFGDSLAIVGVNINFSQALFTKNALDSANTGSTNQGPFRHIAGPEQGQAGHVVQRWYGTSPDGSRAAGTVISTTDPPIRQTPAMLEVQGAVCLVSTAQPAAQTAGAQAFSDTAAGALACVEASGLAGRVQIGGQTQLITNNVTGTTGALATVTVNAGDAEAGSVYELIAFGDMNIGATPAAIQFGCLLNGVVVGISRGIAAAAIVSNQAVRWQAKIILLIRSAGAAGTALLNGMLVAEQTANDAIPGTAADWAIPCAFGASTTTAINTTAANTLGLQVATSGTVSVDCIGAYLKKVA